MTMKIALLLFLNFSLMAQMPFLQGHRGCRGLYPENSLPAFQHALEIGVQVLEMDVCLSADGQVVVSHEPYMNSLYASHPSGAPVLKSEEPALNLFRMTYADICSYDVGKRGNRLFPEQRAVAAVKPLLRDVLALGEAFRQKTGKPIYYNIEIKSDPAEYGISQPKEVADFSKVVHAVIAEQVNWSYVVLQSFDFNVLTYWHGAWPQVTLSALVENDSPMKVMADLGFTPAIYSPSFKQLDVSRMGISHAHGMRVIPWTVNVREDIQKMIDLGVDGLITDYPNRSPIIP
jgi:glycerophosphoryl diester phosphodiesterase